MDTVKRVYDLIDERKITLYQLAQNSGISYSMIKMTEKRGCNRRRPAAADAVLTAARRCWRQPGFSE